MRSVLMGCICAPLAGSMSIWTSGSILNTLDPAKVFIAGVHAGHTHNDTYLRDQALEIVPLVQVGVEPTNGAKYTPSASSALPMAGQCISSVQADEMYIL